MQREIKRRKQDDSKVEALCNPQPGTAQYAHFSSSIRDNGVTNVISVFFGMGYIYYMLT